MPNTLTFRKTSRYTRPTLNPARAGNSTYYYGSVTVTTDASLELSSLMQHLFGANSPLFCEVSLPVDAGLLEHLRLIKYHAASVNVAAYQAPDNAVLTPQYDGNELVIPFASKSADVTALFTQSLAQVLTHITKSDARIDRAVSH